MRVRIPAAHGVVRARRAFATCTSVRRAAVVVLPRVVVVAPRVGPRRRRCAVRVRRARLLAAVCVCVCVRRLAGVLLQLLLLAVVQGRVGLWRWEGLLATEGSRVSFRVILGFGLQKRRDGVGRQVKFRSLHSGPSPQTQAHDSKTQEREERNGGRDEKKEKKHAHSHPHPTPVSS